MLKTDATEHTHFSRIRTRALRIGWLALASVACACGGQIVSHATDGGSSVPPHSSDSGAPSTSGSGSGNGGPADAGDSSTDGSTGTPADAAFSGASTFIALFPVADGALVVAADGVRHIGRDGSSATVWTSPREITAAAYDGTFLGVADKAVLTTLDAAFTTVSSVQLTETCVAALILSGERFVCSPATDWDHISYVFDLKSGTLLNTSTPTTYEGVQMQNVPGTDDFVTVTYGEPAHFDLHRLTATSSIDFLGESPDHGVFPVSEVYTVVGMPGTHVLTETGLLLKIYPDEDAGDTGTHPAPFFKDGALGTLGDSQSFVALDKSDDQIYGLVAARTYDNPLCSSGCWLQHIDATARSTVSTSVHKIDGNTVLGFRRDTVDSHAWLVMSPPGVDTWEATAGFVVYLLDF